MRLGLIIIFSASLLMSCIPVAPQACPDVPVMLPIAVIDTISSTRIFKGEKILFRGHGTNVSGTVVAYEWRSSLDGILSTANEFETSNLTDGTNTIYFRVQNNKGDWSKEIWANITVIPTGAIQPIINYFEGKPETVVSGGSITLRWDVSGASKVRIDPDFGDVPFSGSRIAFPKQRTFYELTATNGAGVTEAIVDIKVTTVEDIIIELSPVISECGYVRSDGIIGNTMDVGNTSSGTAMQAFLSFDITMIPYGSIVKFAALDVTRANIYGQPFGILGGLGVFSDQYGGTLNRSRFIYGFVAPLATSYLMPLQPYSSPIIADAVQRQIDAKSGRFQIRAQFEKYMVNMGEANYIALGEGNPKLILRYR